MATYSFHKISDVKNRARQIARDEGVARHSALDVASTRAGFQNFAHARRLLPEDAAEQRFIVELVQRWRNTSEGVAGTTTLLVSLRQPLSGIVKPNKMDGYLGGCFIDANQQVVIDGFMRDRSSSLRDVMRIARVLRFMDLTGLKPSSAAKRYPKGKWDNRPPIADHDHCWYDPDARVHFLMTEPYPGRADMNRDEHAAWERKHGWRTIRIDRPSLYGFGTELYTICPHAYGGTLEQRLAPFLADREAIHVEDVAVTERRLSVSLA